MAWGASFAWLWGNPLHADVKLQLCTTQPAAAASSPDGAAGNGADGGQGKAKAARSARGATAPTAARAADHAQPVISCARTYQLHANILGSCSPYFLKRTTPGDADGATLQYADAPAAAGGAGGQSKSALLLLVEHVEEGEVGAAEAVLRHCYTAKLCDEGGDAAQLSIAALLQMMVLADRFDVPLCLGHCGEELARRGADIYDVPAVNDVLGGLPPGALSLPSHAAIVSTATERLLQLLGDAEAVGDAWYDPDSTLDAQLLQLSHPALLVLLSSDLLTARSENSVLMMADAWVCNSPAGATCSEAQLRQVVETVRLGFLSHTFAFDVLPALSWLRLSSKESHSLTRFCAADPKRRKSLVEGGRLGGPDAWYRKPRGGAPGGPPAVHTWTVDKADLQGLLAKAKGAQAGAAVGSRLSSLWARKVFHNGFVLSLSVSMIMHVSMECCLVAEAHVSRVLRRAAGGGRRAAQVLHQVWVDEGFQGGPFCAEWVPYENVFMDVLVSYSGRVGADVAEWRMRGMLESTEFFLKESFLSVPCERLLEIGAWEPYLVDGRVQLKGTIQQCE